jgi:hypothetical protein
MTDTLMRTEDEQAFWGRIGSQSAAVYLEQEDWLYRRVESIEWVTRDTLRRRVSVDFEIPKGLPYLGSRAKPGAKLVPVSTLQKWPPLGDFSLIGPDGMSMSLYLSDTNKALDTGLLLGMADSVCGRLSEPLRGDLAGRIIAENGVHDDTVLELTEALRKELTNAVDQETSSAARTLAAKRAEATVNLAGQLANSLVLWVPVVGTAGTDCIVKFTYLDPIRATAPAWKQLLIHCSWWERRVAIALLHTASHTRYHLNVLPPSLGLDLTRAEILGFPGPSIPSTTRAKARGKAESRLSGQSREVSSESRLSVPSPGEASELKTPGDPQQEVPDYSNIIDPPARIYLGYRAAPSHRVLLRLWIAPVREGFITGCAISASAIAVLMSISFVRLSETASSIASTVVLLAAVPVVLAYVLVRPGETAFERYQLVGVRTMALLSGAIPIVGAFIMVLTPNAGTPDFHLVRPEWAVLVIASWILAVALTTSWLFAVPADRSKRHRRRVRTNAPIARKSGLLFAALVTLGAVVECQPYSHVPRGALVGYLRDNRIRVLLGAVLIALGYLALHGFIVGLWRTVAARTGDAAGRKRDRRRFTWVVAAPGLAWIWTTIAVMAVTAWQTLALGTGNATRLPYLAHAIDVTANAGLVPGGIFVITTTGLLVWPADVLLTTRDAAIVLIGLVGGVLLIELRLMSAAWPTQLHLAAEWAYVAAAFWVMIVAAVPKITHPSRTTRREPPQRRYDPLEPAPAPASGG